MKVVEVEVEVDILLAFFELRRNKRRDSAHGRGEKGGRVKVYRTGQKVRDMYSPWSGTSYGSEVVIFGKGEGGSMRQLGTTFPHHLNLGRS